MNAHEARSRKLYEGYDLKGPAMVSAETKIFQLISSGESFFTWPKEINADWKKEVAKDLEAELVLAHDRTADLLEALSILNKIEV